MSDTVKIIVARDEYWPFQIPVIDRKDTSTAFEVDKTTLKRWERVLRQFEEVQEEIRVAQEEARKGSR